VQSLSQVHVKICGIQPGDNLDFTRTKQVSHIGFVFEKESARYISPNEARDTAFHLDSSCKPVGVFRNKRVTSIAEICKIANLKTVQLHGDESPETCQELKELGLTVWKCISIPVTANRCQEILNKASAYLQHVDAILLDSSIRENTSQVMTGGTGLSFSWSLLGGNDGLISQLKPMNVWVAGGIKPENVSRLLDICDPFGIDISSGVEQSGRKSMDRISELIKVVSSSGANFNYTR
jgi:phosphoribosylanthranilate isomerase